MSNEKNEVTRREAIKGLGVGVIASLPVLGSAANPQNKLMHDHMSHGAQKATTAKKPAPLKFFTEAENRTLIEMSERIIPTDDNSPGAKEARVSEYIDMVASIANDNIKKDWRDGLAAINKMSRDMFGKDFADTTEQQQIQLLTVISKNEMKPPASQTAEEKFFKMMKGATIDGYYTSEIGIHKELKYRGNSYIKEFTGCTHPEHQQG
jgi:hypothetical protein